MGLDSSRDMIAAASNAYPGWKWIEGDAATWESEYPLDLIFSNAALQWVKRHDEVLPHLMAQLDNRGVLAIQMPAHFNSPIHQLILQIAGNPDWKHLMREATQSISVGRPSWYYDILQPYSAVIDIWETEYSHIMESHAAILEWIRGTGLRPYLEALENEAQKKQFEDMLLKGLKNVYWKQKDGHVLFPFRRLFIIAVKNAVS
jgi:trans-aconitate 2-methyltransferase